MGRSGRGSHYRGIRGGRRACEPHRDATRDDSYSARFVRRRRRPIAGSGQLHAALGVRSAAAGHLRRLVSAATISFEAIGTTAQLTLADGRNIDEAEALMRMRLREIARAASRFRPDSEIALVEAMGGPRRVSTLLSGAVHTALAAARDTGGAVDPTARPGTPGRWEAVRLDPHRRVLSIPDGIQIDVGATGKALMADRIARDVARMTRTAVLVNLGGDIACAGNAPWDVGVADDHKATAADQIVRVRGGGVATSSTVVRPGHIIDPATGEPVDSPWRTVTIAARSCVAANTASTAAIVLGVDAPRWLAA